MVAAVRTRRRLLAAATAIALATLAAGCSTTPRNTNLTDLTFVSYGGATQEAMVKAWQEPFRHEHPSIRFINTSPPDAGQVKAQVDAGAVGWNLVSTPPWLAMQNCGTVYERLDIPDLDLDEFPSNAHGECYIADYRYSVVFSYNAEKWPDPATAPRTVQDFFDLQKFPGKRGVVASLPDGILEWALIADGVDPAGLYPLDVDRALAKWESIRGETAWTSNPDELLSLVSSAQVDMQLLVQSRSLAAIDHQVKIVPVWNVTVTSVSGLAIPLGAPYRQQALEFMSFLLQSEQQERIAELLGVSPINLEAKPTQSVNSIMVDGLGSANTGSTVAVDQVWWSQNWADASTKFNTWRNPPAA